MAFPSSHVITQSFQSLQDPTKTHSYSWDYGMFDFELWIPMFHAYSIRILRTTTTTSLLEQIYFGAIFIYLFEDYSLHSIFQISTHIDEQPLPIKSQARIKFFILAYSLHSLIQSFLLDSILQHNDIPFYSCISSNFTIILIHASWLNLSPSQDWWEDWLPI